MSSAIRFNLDQSEKNLFLHVCSANIQKLYGKKRMVQNQQFLLFQQGFLPSEALSTISIKFQIVIFKPFKFGRI